MELSADLKCPESTPISSSPAVIIAFLHAQFAKKKKTLSELESGINVKRIHRHHFLTVIMYRDDNIFLKFV